MAYRFEGKELVIDGWENGIADSPYAGTADIRNMDLVSIPSEASVALATSATITQAPISGVSFTVNTATDTCTYNGTVPLENNTAIIVAGTLSAPLATFTAYYIINKTATTFQLSLTAGGSAIDLTTTAGPQTFSTINMSKPRYKTTSFSTNGATSAVTYLYFLIDDNGRVWYYNSASQWIYLNNLGGSGGEANAGQGDNGNGIVAYKRYLLIFRQQQVGYIQILDATYNPQTIAFLTSSANWTRSWKTLTSSWLFTNVPNDIIHQAIVSPTDDNVYFCNINSLGSIVQVAGKVFNPTDATTYTFSVAALALPVFEIAQCVASLVTNLLIGGVNNIVYSWDRISIGYNPIPISENLVSNIVAVNTTAYFFAGRRGRIFICNGSSAQFFKKVPDHISGQPNPYYTWGDAVASREQIYFGVQATDNAGVAIDQYGGLWALDLKTTALRIVNQMSHGTYAGIISVLINILGTTLSDGFGLIMGWYTTTGGVDKGSPTPYTGTQAYIDTEIIPIGQFLNKYTFESIEFKLAAPLVNGEGVTLAYRTNLSASYTAIGTTTTVGALSDLYLMNFDNVQWIQLRAQNKSTATTPSYTRFKEIRLR